MTTIATRQTITDAMLGQMRILVRQNQRVLVIERGQFAAILGPGEHRVSTAGGVARPEFELFDVTRPEATGPLITALLRERPDLAAEHLTVVRTSPDQIGVILRDDRIYGIQKPDAQSVVWTAAGPWRVALVDISKELAVAPDVMRRLERFGASDKVTRFLVEQDQVGLLFVDGAFQRQLGPGAHMFWSVGRQVRVRLVDTRRQSLDVTGQEILTKDRVSIRVNLAADYRVVDPVTAASAVKDFAEALHRSVQYALRTSLGAKTLDEILEHKVTVDSDAAAQVRAEMRVLGVEVGEIALKDVTLPGEMREILNTVVQAEKQAQANVIRRREETAATRSLLNTAKVMAENPIMLRLKELEALEAIAAKVDSLVVHNGPKGLMSDIAKLAE